MPQPLDRPPFHQVSADKSDDETGASTVSTATQADDVRESDEEFVERDSETEHSAEDYQDQTTMSEGSSEHWDEDLEDDGDEHGEHGLEGDDHVADDNVDNDHGQDTEEWLDHSPVDITQVLEATSLHVSPIACLSVVLHSLDMHKGDAVNHARDARGGGAEAEDSPTRGTGE
ncbi:hypothetical protein LTR70_010249 [Exophiala xenobiotica]|uniref:Uncharacterized protein n=1 Tax=Lithohypha guttulata TaxID=1690604 RepID=A0ABR0JUE4_9EURO|nr:hypothetical protein LTR24_010262 [Lithohypha guttulata]KAK5309483.1 hypothetical protein LTR70_010249 [Exophiala xenobiotica]